MSIITLIRDSEVVKLLCLSKGSSCLCLSPVLLFFPLSFGVSVRLDLPDQELSLLGPEPDFALLPALVWRLCST